MEERGRGKRGMEKRDIEKRGIEKRGIEKRGIEKRGIEKRGIEKRGIEKRGMEKHDIEKRGMEKRGIEKREMGKRGIEKRGMEKHDIEKRAIEKCGIEKRGLRGIEKHSMDNSGNGKSERSGIEKRVGGMTGVTAGSKEAGGSRGKISKFRDGERVGKRAESAGNQESGAGKQGRRGFGGKSGEGSSGRRRKTPCAVYEQCGGCQLLHLSYEEQLAEKQRRMEELLKGVCPVKPIIGMKSPWHYRNKVHAVFGHDRKGNPISGVYKEGTHILIPVDSCLIEDEKADEIIGTIRGMLKSFKIRTFDEDTGYGLLRHVLVRRGFATGEIMVVLVTASPVFPSKNNFIRALREKHPEITTIVQNINGRSTSMVLGDKEHVLFGKGYIEDVLCCLRFRISSKSFYQVNPVQTELLYNKAMELAGLTGKEKILDAYCGIGTIGLIASKKAGQVIGVELNSDAVRDAVQNAKMNEVKNIQFYCNDAGRFIADMAEKGEKVDVVIMDPPRSGSTKEFIDAVGKMGPERVVYVSCGPETLVRDLRWFRGVGYRGVAAWPVDMFGGTGHVECVVKLCRVEK